MATDRHSSHPFHPRPILVGREREQARLRELLAATINGNGNLALIGGEAGIGKTTLVRDLVRHSFEQGCLILSGGCYDLATTPPYGPWSEVMRSYHSIEEHSAVPFWFENPQEMGIVGSQTALFEETHRFFTRIADQQPLLIVLEDLHWCDPASMDLLSYLSHRIHELGALIIITYRDDELTRRHALFQLLPVIARAADAVRIEPRRLDVGAIQQLVERYGLCDRDRVRLVAYLEQRAGGNPFFITELLRALESEDILQIDGTGARLGELDDGYLPPFVVQVIERRLARLDTDTRRALEIAAILGQEVPFDLWEKVGQLDQATLDSVVERAIQIHSLEEATDHHSVVFSHALMREVLYEGIIPTRRRAWHRQVGEVLVAMPNPDPDVVAYHFRKAGDHRAVEWFVRAGMRARQSEAWITAAERFAVAAMLLEGDSSRIQERGWLLFFTGFLLRHSNEPHVIDALDEAEQISITIADPVLSAYTRYARGARRSTRGDIRRGIEELEQAVEEIDILLDSHDLLDTNRQAASVIQRLLPETDRDDGPQQTIRNPNVPRVNHPRSVLINWIAHAGRYREAAEIGERYLAVMNAAFGSDYRSMPQIVSCLHGMGLTYAGLGRPEDARRHFALDRAIATSISDHAVVEQSIWSELYMALIPYQTYELTQRSRLIEDAKRAWNRCRGVSISTAGDSPPSALRLDLLEGRWQKARQLATDHLSGPWIVHIQGGIVTLGILDRYQGKPDDAWQHVAALLPEGPATEPGDCYFPHVIMAIRLAAGLALDAGNLAKAGHWIETHSRWLDWSGAVLWRAELQLLRARFHKLSGNLILARQHADLALDLASDPRQPLALIASHRMLGELATQEKRFAEAEEHLQQSLSLAEACAAPYEQALTQLALSELWLTTGNLEAARLLLDRVRDLCLPLDAKPALARTEELASRLTDHTTGQSGHPAGLTSREAEILSLIAAGKSNREIAETLFLSPRTIERHIANIYLKIDVHTKAEAAAYARRHQLT